MPKRRLTIEEHRAFHQCTLARIAEHMGKEAPVQLHPSNMAAGPCQACITVARQSHSVSTAPLPPFAECDRPDQCGCLWGLDTDRWLE